MPDTGNEDGTVSLPELTEKEVSRIM
jgi:hypothetical protein